MLLFCVAVIIVGRDPGVDFSSHVPTLGVFAVAAFRLFPILGNLGNQWVAFISRKAAATIGSRRNERGRGGNRGFGSLLGTSTFHRFSIC